MNVNLYQKIIHMYIYIWNDKNNNNIILIKMIKPFCGYNVHFIHILYLHVHVCNGSRTVLPLLWPVLHASLRPPHTLLSSSCKAPWLPLPSLPAHPQSLASNGSGQILCLFPLCHQYNKVTSLLQQPAISAQYWAFIWTK